MRLKIRYNSPVILTFALISVAALGLGKLTGFSSTLSFFTAYPSFGQESVFHYLGFVTHIFGHANWEHLAGNFLLVLLIGPLLEERHGSWQLTEMIFITALITSVVNAVFFSNALIGASGIVFMLILLGSFSNFRKGEIPLTFLLVAFFYLGKEVVNALEEDHISQFAHIIGGLIGAGFGFMRGGGFKSGQATPAPETAVADEGPPDLDDALNKLLEQ